MSLFKHGCDEHDTQPEHVWLGLQSLQRLLGGSLATVRATDCTQPRSGFISNHASAAGARSCAFNLYLFSFFFTELQTHTDTQREREREIT